MSTIPGLPGLPGLPIFQGTTSSGDKSISGCSVGSESSKSGPQMCDIVPASSSVSDASFCWNRLSHCGSDIIEWHWMAVQHSFATARGMPFIPRLWQELCRHVLILDICRLSTTHCSSPEETNERRLLGFSHLEWSENEWSLHKRCSLSWTYGKESQAT